MEVVLREVRARVHHVLGTRFLVGEVHAVVDDEDEDAHRIQDPLRDEEDVHLRGVA